MEEADTTEGQCGDSTCHVHEKDGQTGMMADCSTTKRRSPSFLLLLVPSYLSKFPKFHTTEGVA
jgi:hypothetical protein